MTEEKQLQTFSKPDKTEKDKFQNTFESFDSTISNQDINKKKIVSKISNQSPKTTIKKVNKAIKVIDKPKSYAPPPKVSIKASLSR